MPAHLGALRLESVIEHSNPSPLALRILTVPMEIPNGTNLGTSKQVVT